MSTFSETTTPSVVHLILINIIVGSLGDIEVSRDATRWKLDDYHEGAAGGPQRITGDGPKAEFLPDPVTEMGILNAPGLTEEQIVTHPNFHYLSPLSECGFRTLEEVDEEEDDNDPDLEEVFLDRDDSVEIVEPPAKIEKSARRQEGRIKEEEDEVASEEEESLKRKKRIVGGRAVKGPMHPWMVQIYLVNISSGAHLFHCAGTLISNQTVLTAAHCLTRIPSGTSLDVVVTGHLDRRKIKFCSPKANFYGNCSRLFIRDIDDFEVHAGYSEGNLNHDVGLIYLKEPVKISAKVRPICLPFSPRLLENWRDVKLTAVGWGSMEKFADATGRSSEVLKQVELDLQQRSLCDKYHTRMYGKTLENRICIGGNVGRGTCNGDSGGGLLKTIQLPFLNGDDERIFQLGIVSAGGHMTNTCGFQGRPIIAINVLFYMNWILNHVSPGVLPYIYLQNEDEQMTRPGVWTGSGSDDEEEEIIPRSHSVYVNEFSTGRNVDVSKHPNVKFLPSFKTCGNVGAMTSNVVTEWDRRTSTTHRPTSSKAETPLIPFWGESQTLKRKKRIVGGIPTTLDNYLPFMAQIYVRNVETNDISLRCSGSIISKRHVLTAAHCVTEVGIPFVFDSVIVGQYNRNSSKECIFGSCFSKIRAKIEDVVVHSEYEKYTHKHNIALIRLAKDLVFTKMVQPICLPQREVLIEGINVQRYFTAGWGRVLRDVSGSKALKLSEILLQMFVDILPRRNCDFVYSRSVDMLDRSRICGGGRAAQGECTGDGGSPLMKQLVPDSDRHPLHNKVFQLGIVSFTDCGLEGMPTVYINLIYYIKWILDNLNAHSSTKIDSDYNDGYELSDKINSK